jgi:hypothetical protein
MNELPETPPEPSEGDSRPMQPLDRYKITAPGRKGATGRLRSPIGEVVTRGEDVGDAADPFFQQEERPRAAHREADPIFAYLLIISLAIGLAPLDAMLRYAILWTLMSVLGAIAYLLGGVKSIREASLDDLVWGISFGFLSSFPFLLVFGPALGTITERMFDVEDTPAIVMDTWVFMAVAFVIPLSESLFFRGGLQTVRSLPLTTLLATFWSAVLFFPHMELAGRETIGVIMLIVFSLLNFMYSYVRFRNGLAAAWLSQVVSYTLLWYFPRLLF